MRLDKLSVSPIVQAEEPKYQQLMGSHHYLGAIPKIGETLWYKCTYEGQWIALISFSAAALNCAVRDDWIGWRYRQQQSLSYFARVALQKHGITPVVIVPEPFIRRLDREIRPPCSSGRNLC